MHETDMIARDYGDCAFLLHKRSRRAMFVDGPLAPFAVRVADNPAARLDEEFLREFPEAVRSSLRTDAEELRGTIHTLGAAPAESPSAANPAEPTAYARLHAYALEAWQLS